MKSRPDGEDADPREIGARPEIPPKGESRSGSKLARWIAVAGGVGYVPRAPGTAGSAVAALGFVALVMLAGRTGAGLGRGAPFSLSTVLSLYVLVVAGLLWLGIWAAGRAEADFGHPDDGRIVIDEVVGQLLTLGPLLFIPVTEDFFSLSVGVVTGFVLFRVFDIWKPGAVRWAERRFEGGLGVMADDVLAGIFGAVVLLGVGGLARVVLGWSPM